MLLRRKRPPGRSRRSRRARARPRRGRRRGLDVRVDRGTIAALGERLDANEHRVVDGEGLVLAPGVRRSARPPAHARPRGRGGHRLGTRSGGRRRLLRDPRDAEHRAGRRLGRRARRARRAGARRGRGAGRASSPRSRRARTGDELTEMVELAEAGAAGLLGRRPACRRRRRSCAARSSTARVAGRRIALHCEEPTLSRGGQMHEGAVSAELGFGGLPVGRREPHGRPRPRARRATRAQPLHLLHLSARESVEALRAARERGVRGDRAR